MENLDKDFAYFTGGGIVEVYEPHMLCIRSEIMPDGGYFFVYLVGAYNRWLYFPCVPADINPLAEGEIPLLSWMSEFLPAYLVDTESQTVQVLQTLEPVREAMPDPEAILQSHLRQTID